MLFFVAMMFCCEDNKDADRGDRWRRCDNDTAALHMMEKMMMTFVKTST
jgi:hypothetical protein